MASASGEAEPAKVLRLSGSRRREELVDAAAALVSTGDVHDVSMEAVAERAGVSRPLVYKHFANRYELLAAVYRREAVRLHDELAAEVTAAGTVEEMFRALVRGSLRAAAERGQLFTALRAAGAWSRQLREEQRARDRDTVRAFGARSARQFGLDRRLAMSLTAMLLGALDSVLTQWRLRPTEENAALLEHVYMTTVTAAYAAMGASTEAPPAPAVRRTGGAGGRGQEGDLPADITPASGTHPR
jgi:AcrR family transcriptional regulator